MVIADAHCHAGKGVTCSLSPDELLRQLDAHSVAAAVIVPVDRCIAVYNREGNDEIMAAARAHPARLIPFVTVNPWYGPAALEELKRTFDAGAAGVKLHPVLQGFSPIDEVALPVVELAVGARRPVYVHTGTPVHSTPYQVLELASRYPEGSFIVGHAAYSDYWNDLVAAVRAAPNLYVETSLHLASFLRVLVEQLGPERLVYGSDYPRTSMEVEIDKITRYLPDGPGRELIFSGNLARLLGERATWL